VTTIEWTATVHPDGTVTPGKTWNPVTGCTKVSPGCKNCYAEGVAERFWAKQYQPVQIQLASGDGDGERAREFTDVQCHEDRLLAPLAWRKPVRVFVNSMSDLFHEDVPDAFIDKVFGVMALAPQHTFQILTKRPERMRDYLVGIYSPRGAERRLLAAEAIYGDAVQRGRRLRIGEVGRDGDRRRGSNLATKAAAVVRTDRPVRTDESRGLERPVSAGQGDDERRSEVCGSASAGLAPLQRSDSAREDRQSQGRRDGQQPAVEFGAGDIEGADRARLRGVEAQESGSSRGVEHQDPLSGQRRESDSGAGGPRGTARCDSEGLQHQQGRSLPDRVAAFLEAHPVAAGWFVGAVLPNVWAGTSIENQHFADERIPLLLQTPAAVRFISAEPLLGPVDLTGDPDPCRTWLRSGLSAVRGVVTDKWLPPLDQVIVGGESGPGARPCDLAWTRSIVAQCKAAGVACFVKQLGTRPVMQPAEVRRLGFGGLRIDDEGQVHLRDRKGCDMAEWSEDLRVREFPEVRA